MSYYSVTGNPVYDTRGTTPQIRAEFALIAAGFAMLPVPATIWGGSANYGVDSGAAGAYVVSIASTYITGYTDGLTIRVKATAANTGASTINLNGLGIKSIVRPDGTVLAAGDIVAGAVITLTYDATAGKFQLSLNGLTSATAAAASAAAAASSASAAAGSASAAAGSATAAAGSATAAAGSATSAANYLTIGTSATSVLIATGAKSFTATAGKAWGAGQFLTLSSNANSANYMHGAVTSYNSTTGALVMNVLDIGGSGTLADWNIAVSGTQGPIGATGPTGGSIFIFGSASSSGSITLTAASKSMQKLAFTAHGQSVTMPDATTLAVGTPACVLHNTSEFVGRILNNSGTLIGVLAPGDAPSLSLEDNSTAAGSWSVGAARPAGPTAQLSVTGTNIGGATYFQAIPLDSTRTMLLYGTNGLYGIVYDKSTQTWGSPTLIRASVVVQSIGILIAANQVLVCSAVTTAMETTVLSVSGTTITINTPTATTLASGVGAGQGFQDIVQVGTSWVVSLFHAGPVGLRAITVAGTTPTVGAELTFLTGGQQAHLYVSGSVVLAFGGISGGAGAVKATPYTVSGSTLTLGTGASFGTAFVQGSMKSLVLGTRWLLYYLDGTNYTAALVSLSGTTATVSTVASSVTANATSADAIVCNGKVIITGTDGFTSEWVNVLTDTAGTLSAGTVVALPGFTTPLVPVSVSGTTANFFNSSQYYSVSAAAASAVVSILPSVARTGAFASTSKNGSGAANLVYGGAGAILATGASNLATLFGTAVSRGVDLGIGSPNYNAVARGNTTAELWTLQVNGTDPRYSLQLVEAAQ